jgi:hypothetical protein
VKIEESGKPEKSSRDRGNGRTSENTSTTLFDNPQLQEEFQKLQQGIRRRNCRVEN